VTRWSQDPFAIGAYSELQTRDASGGDRDILSLPEGRLFFAGEAAVPGTVGAQCTHGALLSGASVGLEVLEHLGLGGASFSGLAREGGLLGLDMGALIATLLGRLGDVVDDSSSEPGQGSVASPAAETEGSPTKFRRQL